MYKISWILGINYNFGQLKKYNLIQPNDFHFTDELDVNMSDIILNYIKGPEHDNFQLTINKLFPNIQWNLIKNAAVFILDSEGDLSNNIMKDVNNFKVENSTTYKNSLDEIHKYIKEKFPKLSNQNMDDINTNWFNLVSKYKEKLKEKKFDTTNDSWDIKMITRTIARIGQYLKTAQNIKNLKQDLINNNFLAYYNDIYNQRNWLK